MDMEEYETKLFSAIEEEFARFVIDNYLVAGDSDLLIRDREGEIDAIASFEYISNVINLGQFQEHIKCDFIDDLTNVALKVLEKYGMY